MPDVLGFFVITRVYSILVRSLCISGIVFLLHCFKLLFLLNHPKFTEGTNVSVVAVYVCML